MTEDSSNTQPPAGEPEKIPGYVKLKIREQKTLKERPPVARARTRASLAPNGPEKLSDLLTPHLPAAVKVWIDGLKANKIAWNPDTRSWEETDVPDHDARRKNALHILEYIVGKPIERSMEVSGNYKELSELVDELKKSPEAQRLISAGFFTDLLSGQSTESKDPAPVHERLTISPPEQKTG